MAIPNKFNTKCSNPFCPEKRNRYNGLPAGIGFACKQNGTWKAFCESCCPERIVSPTVIERKITAGGKVFTPFEKDNLPLLRSFPGARWNSNDKCWDVSTSQSDRERVLEIANKLQLNIAPELRNIEVTEQASTAIHKGLYPFQVKGVQFLSIGKNRLLGDEMGTGKTPQSLCALPKNTKTLVVCPNAVKFNWKQECLKWRPDLTPTVLTSKTSFRWPSTGEVLIINYESLPDRFDFSKDKPAKPTEGDVLSAKDVILVGDEIHRCKSYKSQRSKKFKTISNMVSKTFGLTGTPLLTRPSDLWGVLDSCGMAKEVFGSWSKFMQLYGAYKDRWGGITWGDPSPEVPERLRRVMLRRTREEVLPDLPKKTYTTITVNNIRESTRKKLDELEKTWGEYMEFSQELPPFEEFSKIRAELAESRIEEELEYIEDCEEQDIPLVVASAHRAPIDVLEKREGWAVIHGGIDPESRQEAVNAFQNGRLRGIGITIQSGGIGINLTRAWRMLFCDQSWTPAENSQCEDRICRIGQENSKVEIVRMVSNHPLDKHIMNLIAMKIAMIEASIEYSVKPIVSVPSPKIEGETEEQFQSRMESLKASVNSLQNAVSDFGISISPEKRSEIELLVKKEEAKTRVKRMAAKFKSKIGDWISQPITPELDMAIKEAFKVMVSNDPDMATLRNGVGFNQPDSYMARWLGYNLNTDDECRSMLGLLYKYKRQLQGQFPLLFPK